MSMRIGVLGGTFDPIHHGHIRLAKIAYEDLSLNKLSFVPSGNSYMKDNVSSAIVRKEMVDIALLKYKDFECCDVDIVRVGRTYTFDTLTDIKLKYPDSEIFFIIGSDTLFTMCTWYRIEDVLSMCTVVVMSREEDIVSDIQNKIDFLCINSNCSIIYLKNNALVISSSEIKTAIKNKDYEFVNQY